MLDYQYDFVYGLFFSAHQENTGNISLKKGLYMHINLP